MSALAINNTALCNLDPFHRDWSDNCTNVCNFPFVNVKMKMDGDGTHKGQTSDHGIDPAAPAPSCSVHEAVECTWTNSDTAISALTLVNTDNEPYICDICNKKCNEGIDLCIHMRTHSDNINPYRCKVCSHKALSLIDLLAHLDTHRVYTCKYCDCKFARKHTFIRHERANALKKRFYCKCCCYKNVVKSNLVLPESTRTEGKAFSCKYCAKKFWSWRGLRKHMRHHASVLNGEAPYFCEYCGYKCSQKTSLLSHWRTHTGEKPYSCEHCDYKCSRKQSLLEHLRTHTGEKPYSCEHCDYKCSARYNLVLHLRTHTGEKPFPCEYCDYKCSQKQSLLRHIRTHTGEKPYVCEYCGYTCSRKFSLLSHMKTHTGEKRD